MVRVSVRIVRVRAVSVRVRVFIIIITFLFTQGMPKQLKTGFHWGPACVNIKIEYREYGNPRQNNNYIPHHK